MSGDRERIFERLREQSSWQSPAGGSYPTPEPPRPPNGSRNTTLIIVAGLGVVALLGLFFAAGGTPGGGGAGPSQGLPGSVAVSALTEEAAAEAVGRFYLAALTGDVSTFEALIDPSQLPLSTEIRDTLEQTRVGYAESGTPLSPTIGWQGESFVIEIVVPDASSERLSLVCTPLSADSWQAEVEASTLLNGEATDEGITFGLIAAGGVWKVESIDGESIQSAFY